MWLPSKNFWKSMPKTAEVRNSGLALAETLSVRPGSVRLQSCSSIQAHRTFHPSVWSSWFSWPLFFGFHFGLAWELEESLDLKPLLGDNTCSSSPDGVRQAKWVASHLGFESWPWPWRSVRGAICNLVIWKGALSTDGPVSKHPHRMLPVPRK